MASLVLRCLRCRPPLSPRCLFSTATPKPDPAPIDMPAPSPDHKVPWTPLQKGRRRPSFQPFVAGSNVIGMMDPLIMNRMRFFYPAYWFISGSLSVGSIGLLCFWEHDFDQIIGPSILICCHLVALYNVAMMWYYSKVIGKLVLWEDGTKVTLSHVTLIMGRRVDRTFDVKELTRMTRHDHKQFIGEKNECFFINWSDFKVNERLWRQVLPSQEGVYLIPDKAKRRP